MKNEIWKDISGYEGLYQVSNFGRVKHLVIKNKDKRSRLIVPEHIVKGTIYSGGYTVICLTKNGIVKRESLHRLVAIAFIPKIKGKEVINHIDGNKQNNNVNNLEWCTNEENLKHAWRTGLIDVEKARECGRKTVKFASEKRKKVVIQLTLDHQFVNRFESAVEAEKMTGVSNKHIGSVCNGNRTTAGGYIWRHGDTQ